MITVNDCINLLAKHKVLKNWTVGQAAYAVEKAIETNCMAYGKDENGNLESIVIGRWNDSCSIHIIAIAGKHGCLKTFFKHLKVTHPQVKTLTAVRYGKETIYHLK